MADAELYGLIAEFDSPERLIDAARRTRADGYRELDAFTPFPVEEMAEVLEFRDRRVLWFGLIGAVFGATLALAMQLFTNWDYPTNIGGRPGVLLSPPPPLSLSFYPPFSWGPARRPRPR